MVLFWVCYDFLVRDDSTTHPKKELHWSHQLLKQRMTKNNRVSLPGIVAAVLEYTRLFACLDPYAVRSLHTDGGG